MRVMKDVTCRPRMAWLLGFAAILLAPSLQIAAAPQEASPAYDAQDARLNTAYKKLSASLDEAGRKALRDEERQWIVGRDIACKVPTGTVVKNQCTTTQTSFRADELEKRGTSNGKAASGGSAALAGDWAYRTDCNLGHDAEISVQKTAPGVEGTWSDGTRHSGSQGRFMGDWRDGKLFVRFCTEDAPGGGYPACPAYGDVAGYLSPEGTHLVWYRAVGTPAERTFNKYVVLGRKPKDGDVPKDAVCHDA